MNVLAPHKSRCGDSLERSRRIPRGLMLFEAIVAAILVAAAIGVAVPMAIQRDRVRAQQGQRAAAQWELSNRMDAWTSLPLASLPAAIESPVVSELAKQRLHNPSLEAKLYEAEKPPRLVLTLSWDERPDRRCQAALAGWLAAGEDSAAAPVPEVEQAEESL
ncbi:MAG: hypothetical protein KDA61_01310 [Planctomycetales bacterium]|nr:hypothetical protein [Planctomycetales bacterium]